MPTVCKIICDASEYTKALDEAVARGRAAAAQLAELGGTEAPNIAVGVDTAQVDEAKTKVAELAAAESPNIDVDVDADEVDAADADVHELESHDGDTVKITVDADSSQVDVAKTKVSSLGAELKNGWKSLTDFHGGFKKLTSAIGAGGGPIGIFIAAIASLGKIIGWVCDQFRQAREESLKLAQTNAESVREVAAANAELQQKTDGYMSQLADLASAEKLSNEQKAQAASLIAALGKSYRDLGVEVDAATGKLKGFDEAAIRKAEQDRARKLYEIDAELKDLAAEKELQSKKRDDAGVPTGIDGWRIGGKDDVDKAEARIKEIGERSMELRRQRDEVKNSDRTAEIRASREGELKDLEAQATEAERARVRSDYDERYNELLGAGDHLGAAELKRTQLKNFQQGELAEAENKVAAAEKNVADAKNDDARREAKINLLQVQKELNAAKEKELAIQRQIAAAENKSAEAGERAAAASDKLREEYAKKRLAIEQQIADAAGSGAEYAAKTALDAEEKRRGRPLDDDERDSISRLAKLEWEMSHDTSRELLGRQDLSIKSDALTARGGFRNGAVAPDADKWNRLKVDLQKASRARLDEIAQILKRLEETSTAEGE